MNLEQATEFLQSAQSNSISSLAGLFDHYNSSKAAGASFATDTFADVKALKRAIQRTVGIATSQTQTAAPLLMPRAQWFNGLREDSATVESAYINLQQLYEDSRGNPFTFKSLLRQAKNTPLKKSLSAFQDEMDIAAITHGGDLPRRDRVMQTTILATIQKILQERQQPIHIPTPDAKADDAPERWADQTLVELITLCQKDSTTLRTLCDYLLPYKDKFEDIEDAIERHMNSDTTLNTSEDPILLALLRTMDMVKKGQYTPDETAEEQHSPFEHIETERIIKILKDHYPYGAPPRDIRDILLDRLTTYKFGIREVFNFNFKDSKPLRVSTSFYIIYLKQLRALCYGNAKAALEVIDASTHPHKALIKLAAQSVYRLKWPLVLLASTFTLGSIVMSVVLPQTSLLEPGSMNYPTNNPAFSGFLQTWAVALAGAGINAGTLVGIQLQHYRAINFLRDAERKTLPPEIFYDAFNPEPPRLHQPLSLWNRTQSLQFQLGLGVLCLALTAVTMIFTGSLDVVSRPSLALFNGLAAMDTIIPFFAALFFSSIVSGTATAMKKFVTIEMQPRRTAAASFDGDNYTQMPSNPATPERKQQGESARYQSPFTTQATGDPYQTPPRAEAPNF